MEEPERLAAWVAEYGADALLSADGDGDRPLVVDEKGKIIRGDVLGILVSAALKADAVATPVSCNTALELSGWFPKIRRTRIGSPYVIEAMNALVESGAERVVGYEANGGFLTATEIPSPAGGAPLAALPTRDAVLPILTVLLSAKNKGVALSQLVAELPQRFTASGLKRGVPNEKGKALVAKLAEGGEEAVEELFGDTFGAVASLDFTDGGRITFDTGDIVHLRPSGNAPEFRCYTEADTEREAIENNETALAIIAAVL